MDKMPDRAHHIWESMPAEPPIAILTDKEGKSYNLYRSAQKQDQDDPVPSKMEFHLFDPQTRQRIGRIAIWHEKKDLPQNPVDFLDVPSEADGLPFYRSEIMVNPKYRSKGLGLQLAQHLITWCEQQPFDFLHVDFFTPKGLAAFRSFFLNHGYKEGKVTNAFLASQFTGPGEHVWIFKKYTVQKNGN